jgi:hypothetical protein
MIWTSAAVHRAQIGGLRGHVQLQCPDGLFHSGKIQPRAIIKIVDLRRAESSSHGLTLRTRMRS